MAGVRGSLELLVQTARLARGGAGGEQRTDS